MESEQAEEHRGPGRPSLYKPEFVQQAAEQCVAGATLMELADFFGVSLSTIKEWRNVHPEFSTATKVGGAVADSRVERSLFERANGYSHPDVHISAGKEGVTVTPIIKHYPPDTAAAFIWMKNRMGWRDKTEIEHTASGDLLEVMRLARERAGLTPPDKP